MLSLGISLFSMYLVWQYVDSQEADLQDKYGTFYSMVVASRDVLQYQVIRPTDIEVVRVPKAMNPPGRIADPAYVIDSVAAIPISKGEFILDNKIISKNVYSGLDNHITVGRRAMSIPVTLKSSIDYNIRPGNRVDLAAHFEYKTKKADISEVKVFLQDILVLAAGRVIQSDPPKGVDQQILRDVMGEFKAIEDAGEAQEMLNQAKKQPIFQTITVEVTPLQAQEIAYVMTVFPDSMISMLRHSDDRSQTRLPTVNLYKVMGPESYLVRGDKRAPPKAVPRPKFFDYVGDQLVPVY